MMYLPRNPQRVLSVMCGTVACVSLGVTGFVPSHAPLRDRSSLFAHPSLDSIPLATITTDTGAFAPGNKEFSRFTKPIECVEAVNMAAQAFRHTISAQIAHFFQDSTIRGDTLPRQAVTVARSCATRFTVGSTHPENLPDLFTLALMAGDDATANAIIIRRLALSSSIPEKAEVYKDAIDGYLGAEPARIATAESTVKQLDALGSPAQEVRLRGHAALLYLAMSKFDAQMMQREANAIIAIGQEGPVDAIRYHYRPIVYAYKALAQIEYVNGGGSLLALMARAKRDLSRFPPGKDFPPDIFYDPLMEVDYKTVDVQKVRDLLLPFNNKRFEGIILPPVPAKAWFPKPLQVWPTQDGHASLIIYGGLLANSCARSDGFLMEESVERPECRALYTYLPYWKKLYGDRLNITLIAQTAKFAVRSVILPVSAEADTLKWFFLDHLKLPITLGVVEDSMWQLPPIDGREFRMDTTFYGRISGPPPHGVDSPMAVILYDGQGRLQFLGQELEDPVLFELLAHVTHTVPPLAANGERP